MKAILMAVDHLGANGTVTYLLTISKALRALGHTIIVIGRDGILADKFRAEQIPVYEINIPTTFSEHPHEIQPQIESIIDQHKIELIHCHQVYSGISLLTIAKKRKLPYIYTLHGIYNRKEELLKILPESNHVITVSEFVQEQLLQQFNISSHFIPNGIDGNDFFHKPEWSIRQQYQIPEAGFVVLYASRLEFDKADICMRLLKAIDELKQPNLYAFVAGEGFRAKQIHNMIKGMNRKRALPFVHLLGSQQDLLPFYRSVNAVVGTGRTAMEAISCEIPVITAGAKGYSGLVTTENWENMKYEHFADHKANQPVHQHLLKKDIQALLMRKKNTEETIALRQRLLTDYHIEAIVKKLTKLYNETQI